LAKCAWNAIRYYDNREELRTFSGWFSQLGEKRGLYRFQLDVCISGYPWSSWSWTDVFKWAQYPEYYQFATEEEWREHINSLKYIHNITEEVKWHLRFNLVRFSEYDKFYAVHVNGTR
jgi:hypothetical protein